MRRRGSTHTLVLLLADLALTLLALYLAAWFRLYLPYGVRLTQAYVQLPPILFLMSAVVWLTVSAVLSLYNPQHPYHRLDELKAVSIAVLLSNLAFAGLLYLSFRDVPRLLFAYSLVLQAVFLVGLRLAAYTWTALRHDSQEGTRVLIVGAGRVGQELARRIRAEGGDLILAGYLDDDAAKQGQTYEGAPVLGKTDQATRLVGKARIDEVIFALPLRAHQHLEVLVVALQSMPVRVRVVPDFFDLAFFRATIEDFRGMPLIGLRDPAIDGVNRQVKRLFDLVLSVLGLIVTAPLMLLIALAIRLDSPGPALFRQQRVGENGKLFTMYKFRSMLANAGENSLLSAESFSPPRLRQAGRGEEATRAEGHGSAPPVHKQPNDPRVTRVGQYLRRTSLDELPQLANVLKGEMSLVGPRPELPWLVDRYEPWQRKRFAVPPGMTGWWQISGRSDRPMHLHVEDDLYYIQHYSPLLDLHILLRTVAVVLRGKGAY